MTATTSFRLTVNFARNIFWVYENVPAVWLGLEQPDQRR